MTSLQSVVNTRKLLVFRNREWVVNVFSVELAVNLQVYVQPKVIGLVSSSFIVPQVKDCFKFCFHLGVVS